MTNKIKESIDSFIKKVYDIVGYLCEVKNIGGNIRFQSDNLNEKMLGDLHERDNG